MRSDQGGRSRPRRARRGDGARPHAEAPRHPAQLPRGRAPSLPARAVRARAAAVHRHRQRRGAAVQPRPAALGLRVVEAREQLLRLRQRQRHGARRRLPGDQAPHVHRPGRADGDPRRRGGAPAVGQGARRPARAHPRLPARLRRQHLGDELRRAVQERDRGAQPRRCRRRLPAEHRRGRDLAVPPHGRRPGLPDRDVLLRLPRQGRRVRPGPAQGPGRLRAGARDRGQAVAGRQARPRRAAAGGEGQRRDRRDPRHRGRRRLRLAQPSHRLLRRRLDGRLRRAARHRDRAARRHQERCRQPGVLGPPRAADGRATAGRRLRQHRRRRGRHGRLAR